MNMPDTENSKNISSRTNLKADANPDNDPVSEGMNEAKKETTKDTNINQQKLDNLLSLSNNVIFRTTTIFPLDIFPTTLVIDYSQIHVISKMFFLSDRIRSIDIENIAEVTAVVVPFFATLNIVEASSPTTPITLKYLKKDQALKARRIIQGMIISKKMEIDITKMKNDSDLVQKLEKLGSSKNFGAV